MTASRTASGWLVQMSGCPGAGKTTVARALGERLDAVVVDIDVIKSALLDGGVPYPAAGQVAYRVLWAVVESITSGGHSVIVDSPCYYEEILERGQEIAVAAGMHYRYVECVVDDLEEIDRRLTARSSLRSQRAGLHAPPRDLGVDTRDTGASLFREWIANMKRPSAQVLTLDTSQPVEAAVEQAFAYVTDDPEGAAAS